MESVLGPQTQNFGFMASRSSRRMREVFAQKCTEQVRERRNFLKDGMTTVRAGMLLSGKALV
jgi:hypothetical protein